jgi:hypothetical protein
MTHWGPGAAAAGRVARRNGPAPALAPFPVPGRSSLWTLSCCWGGWLVLWRVVCWVGFLSDVISGVESALWEGCYPASSLAHGVCVIVYV